MGKIKEIIKKLKRNRPEESTKNRSPVESLKHYDNLGSLNLT